MSEEAQPPPANPLAITARINFTPPAPTKFTGEGEDLKPKAFDRWYNSVWLYLNLSGVTGNIARSGNYWILYTEGKALEVAHQLLQEHGDEITREQLVNGLREIFQTSRQKDELYERFKKATPNTPREDQEGRRVYYRPEDVPITVTCRHHIRVCVCEEVHREPAS